MREVCVLTCYNRTDYLNRVVDSLSKCPPIHSGEIPVHAFIDASPKSEEVVEVLGKLPHGAECHVRKDRWGPYLNIMSARDTVFKDGGFEMGYFLEDDYLPNVHYFEVMRSLFDWGIEKGIKVGMVASESLCNIPFEEKLKLKACVYDRVMFWTNYAMSVGCWALTREIMNEYRDLFLAGRWFNTFQSLEVCAWYLKKVKQYNPDDFCQNVPESAQMNFVEWKSNLEAGADYNKGMEAAFSIAMKCVGLSRLNTLVNRGLFIGEEGFSMSKQTFDSLGLSKTEQHEIPGDETLKEFEFTPYTNIKL